MSLRYLALVALALVVATSCHPVQEPAPPDDLTECVELTPLWSTTAAPAGVSLHFDATRCPDGPRPDLDAANIDIVEAGQPLADDADLRSLNNANIRPYVAVLLDVGVDEAGLDGLVEATRQFAEELLPDGQLDDARIGIIPFDGDSLVDTPRQLPVDDTEVLHAYLDDIADRETDDNTATDLSNVIDDGVDWLRDHQRRAADHHEDGIVPMGHLVAVTGSDLTATDGDELADVTDRARRADPDAGPGVQPRVVAPESDAGLLESALGSDAVHPAAPGEFGAEMVTAAHAIDAALESSHLFGFCSGLRGEEATVELSVDTGESDTIEFRVDAADFDDGCSSAALDTTCDDRDCGGFLCGGCSDVDEVCDESSGGVCVDYCDHHDLCTADGATNELGHEQVCEPEHHDTRCEGQCVDTDTDDDHCGECGNECSAAASQCVDGTCQCEDERHDCNGTCVDLADRDDHCGMCDHACPDDITCTDSVCPCDGGEIACDGTCVDTDTDDDHCGSCRNACADDEQCVDGVCACADDLSWCGGECVDIFGDDDHCGGCDNVCADDQSCENAGCVCDADGEAPCDDGECIDVLENDDHCGECDNACGDDAWCEEGVCRLLEDRVVRAGIDHTCALDTDGTAICWGLDDGGQADPIDAKFKTISPGNDYTCGVGDNSAAYCWGNHVSDADEAPATKAFVDVEASWNHTCGVETDGSIDCWGDMTNPSGDSYAAVSVGINHSCALETDGSIHCWGDDSDDKTDSPGGSFDQLDVGFNHACALDGDGDVECWGQPGADDERLDAPDETFVQISAGDDHSCGVVDDGTVACWGSDSSGQSETGLPLDGSIRQVSAGSYYTCAIDVDDEITCWGDDADGKTDFPGWD